MKKIISLLLVAIMTMAMTTMAFAAKVITSDVEGNITKDSSDNYQFMYDLKKAGVNYAEAKEITVTFTASSLNSGFGGDLTINSSATGYGWKSTDWGNTDANKTITAVPTKEDGGWLEFTVTLEIPEGAYPADATYANFVVQTYWGADLNITKVEVNTGEEEADPSETDADPSETDADPSETDADTSETDANPSETDADPSETDADPSATDADTSETDADPSETEADPSETDADPSATDADPSATDADPSATDADPSSSDADPSASVAEPSASDADPSASDAPATTTEGADSPDTGSSNVNMIVVLSIIGAFAAVAVVATKKENN